MLIVDAAVRFLGPYRLVDEIGIGQMASVHLACVGPSDARKWVAVKRMHPHLAGDPAIVQLFLDEARVAARVDHPNVAKVHELGEIDDTYWLAMEHLRGETLRELLSRSPNQGGRLPSELACRIVADAAAGLHAAHELLGNDGRALRLVHRDVTPNNLFVTDDAVTKVVDFGIAKFSSRMSGTRGGTLKGKLAYMSPEQVTGETVDRRTDVFALGVILWELTTGQRLFRMESDLDTLLNVQECEPPRPSTIARDYPLALEDIVMRALMKRREERHQTAHELSCALESFLATSPSRPDPKHCLHAIIGERIEHREQYLRWAEEQVRTMDLDPLLKNMKS